jgi:Uma2 family endonuclease
MPTEAVNRKLFTVEEFHRIADILPETCRLELIRGEIFEMPLPESPHSGHVTRLNELFIVKLGRAVNVSVQNPLYIDEYSEVLPDIALLKRRNDFYESAHPSPADVLLAVEVSHKSSNYDSRIKAPLYAEHGIVEYWQLDLKKECLIVRRDLVDGEYRTVLTLTKGQTLSAGQLSEVTFAVDELLG